MPPEPTLKEILARLAAVEEAIESWRHDAKRMRSDWKNEHADMTEGAKRTLVKAIDDGLKPLAGYAADVSRILVLTCDQTSLLEEARNERVRRVERERILSEETVRKEKADARAVLDATIARDIGESQRAHRLKLWGVLVAVLTILGSLAAAAIASHSH